MLSQISDGGFCSGPGGSNKDTIYKHCCTIGRCLMLLFTHKQVKNIVAPIKSSWVKMDLVFLNTIILDRLTLSPCSLEKVQKKNFD